MNEEQNIFAQLVAWLAARGEQVAIVIGIILTSAWGGFVRYAATKQAQHATMKISEMAFELGVSTFAGSVPGMLTYGLTGNVWLTCAASAYAGHLGTRQVFKMINAWLDKKF